MNHALKMSFQLQSHYIFQGFGMLLMEEAERIAREEHGSHKIAVISGSVFCRNDRTALVLL